MTCPDCSSSLVLEILCFGDLSTFLCESCGLCWEHRAS